jgi:rhodanese-related sulfurtransferase
MIKEGAIVVDVRTRKEYGAGARAGSINIPLDEMNRRSNELDNSKQIILCCASGTRSGMAMGVLRKNGFKSVINAGPWTNTLE